MRYLSLLLPLLLTACYADDLRDDLAADPFFDLQGYMSGQIDSLTQRRVPVEKTVTLNGRTETQQRDDVSFANDLRVFREADINKPAWRDKYRIERQEGLTTYVATDSSMQTQQLAIERSDDGRVKRIRIQRKTGTLLSDGRHQLEYVPSDGYRVRTLQTNRFGDDVDAVVTVSW